MSQLQISDFKIHVLVIDQDKEYSMILCETLSKTGICIPQDVTTFAEAQKMIDRSNNRIDVCILEADPGDINEAAPEFIRNNKRKTPCIVVTQVQSAAFGAYCCQAGAKKVFDKKNLDKAELVKDVYAIACIHLINPDYNPDGSDTFDYATGVLLQKCPKTVTFWAECTGITDRQLRGLVKQKSKVSAKNALSLAAWLKNGENNIK
ncbi:MAG: hypothetical protein GX639_19580 [Fibrobacter sp.]|nr:hypothetical protein [Fibrobacter sp.]